MKRPKIRYCSFSDPFVLILREDNSLGLFVGDTERGKIRRKDMTPMGEKVYVYRPVSRFFLPINTQVSRYVAACFYSDQSGIFQSQGAATSLGASNARSKSVTLSLEAAVDSKRGSQWLILCRPQGVMEVRTFDIVCSGLRLTVPYRYGRYCQN